MTEYTLHCFAQSGNAYKVALALAPAVLAEFRKRSEAAWRILNAHLGTRTFVIGDRLTIADLSMCGYLYFGDEFGEDWSTYPALREWLARIAATPCWQHPYSLMPGHPRPAAA